MPAPPRLRREHRSSQSNLPGLPSGKRNTSKFLLVSAKSTKIVTGYPQKVTKRIFPQVCARSAQGPAHARPLTSSSVLCRLSHFYFSFSHKELAKPAAGGLRGCTCLAPGFPAVLFLTPPHRGGAQTSPIEARLRECGKPDVHVVSGLVLGAFGELSTDCYSPAMPSPK